MDTGDKFFVTTTHGMSGYFAVLFWLNEEEDFGPFWEPYESGYGRYETQEEAVLEAKQWALECGYEYRD